MNIKSKQFNTIISGRPNSVSCKDDINAGLRKWKKNLKENQTIENLFSRKFHTKPSDRKRKQMEIAKYNQQKENIDEI